MHIKRETHQHTQQRGHSTFRNGCVHVPPVKEAFTKQDRLADTGNESVLSDGRKPSEHTYGGGSALIRTGAIQLTNAIARRLTTSINHIHKDKLPYNIGIGLITGAVGLTVPTKCCFCFTYRKRAKKKNFTDSALDHRLDSSRNLTELSKSWNISFIKTFIQDIHPQPFGRVIPHTDRQTDTDRQTKTDTELNG